MRRFNIEFLAVGGWHDGVRTRVVDVAMQSPLVTAHEQAHGRIFRETPDGQVHAAFCLALELDRVPAAHRAAVEDTVGEFLESSRLAHESFATYLSVKGISASNDAPLLGQLPNEYLDYFANIADLIDGHYTSSYLQYLVAWNSAVAVFSSPLLERVKSFDVSKLVALRPDENAELRFKAWQKSLAASEFRGLDEVLEAAARAECERRGLKYWDIFSEEAWVAQNWQNGEVIEGGEWVEQAISWAIRDWLAGIVPFTFLLRDRLINAWNGFHEAIREKLNVGISKSWHELGVTGPNVQAQTIAEALHESESRIKNTNAARLQRLPGEILKREELFEKATAFSVYSAAPPGRNLTDWNVVFWRRGEGEDPPPIFAAEFDRFEVLIFLMDWLERKRAGKPAPTLDALVIAVQGFEEFHQILEECKNFIWTQDELCEKLVWYWSGRLFDVYKVFGKKKSNLYSGHIDTDGLTKFFDKDVREMVAQYNGLTLKLLHYSDEPGVGLVMRAYPHHSASRILSLDRELAADGIVTPMPREMLERLLNLSREGLFAAQSLWEEY